MQQPTKYTHQSGSNQSNPCDDADDLVEYLHEVDVCAEEEFWWDEEDRYEL